MRKEIETLAGPRTWGDTRQSWLSRVPRIVQRALGTKKETVPYRMVKSLWYGEIENADEHHAARDIRRAAEIINAQQEAKKLAETFRNAMGNLESAENQTELSNQIARLERVASLLGGRG